MGTKLKIHTVGEILKGEFLDPMGISQYQLAKATGIPQTRVSEIVRGRRAVTLDTALRLAQFFNMSWQFWLNLQTDYNFRMARRDGLVEKIEKDVKALAA